MAATSDDQKIEATGNSSRETGPWGEALATLREWDLAWADACVKVTTNP